MKTSKFIAIIAVIVVVLAGGLYWVYDGLTGNHVEVESVIAQSAANDASSESSGETSTETSDTADSEGTGEVVEVDGLWNIQSDSKVYFSVTTSKTTVNYELPKVTGTWNIDTTDAAQIQAEATVDVTSMDSGNAQRDKHISEAEYLDITQFPDATFKVTSFEGLPTEWKDGEVYTVNIKGDLTVKGITKEVVFAGQTTYDQGSLKLEASTVVTFADFGMTSPHTVVMETENNLTIELRLVLSK